MLTLQFQPSLSKKSISDMITCSSSFVALQVLKQLGLDMISSVLNGWNMDEDKLIRLILREKKLYRKMLEEFAPFSEILQLQLRLITSLQLLLTEVFNKTLSFADLKQRLNQIAYLVYKIQYALPKARRILFLKQEAIIQQQLQIEKMKIKLEDTQEKNKALQKQKQSYANYVRETEAKQHSLLEQFYLFVTQHKYLLVAAQKIFTYNLLHFRTIVNLIHRFQRGKLAFLPQFELFVPHLAFTNGPNASFSLNLEAKIQQLANLHGFNLKRSADNLRLELVANDDLTQKISLLMDPTGMKLTAASHPRCLPLLESLINQISSSQRLTLENKKIEINHNIHQYQTQFDPVKVARFLQAKNALLPRLIPGR